MSNTYVSGRAIKLPQSRRRVLIGFADLGTDLRDH